MSKAEKIKEQIGWLKVIFGILSAIEVSLIGFIATSYDESQPFILILAVVASIIVVFAIIVVNRIALNKIDELEEL